MWPVPSHLPSSLTLPLHLTPSRRALTPITLPAQAYAAGYVGWGKVWRLQHCVAAGLSSELQSRALALLVKELQTVGWFWQNAAGQSGLGFGGMLLH